jgi:hypothetical protein
MPTPVGGSTFNASSTTSLMYNYYYATAGNVIVFFLQFSGAVSGVTVVPHYAGTTLTAGPVVGNLYCFYGTVSGSSQYYWDIAWTGTASLGVACEEYSGATQFSPTNYATASGTSGSASASLTTDDAGGNMIVAGMGNTSSNAFTASVGTQRQQENSVAEQVILLDNSDSSPGSLACTATLTSCAWDVILLELRFVIAAVPGAGFSTKGNSPGQGVLATVAATTNVVMGNDPAQPTYLPYGQTWPRG